MDEEALIKEAKRGDVAAFNRLVLHYQKPVYNVALRIMGESPSAEDATQEAFISAYRALNHFRGGSFKAWLMRIATNACYDELRRRKRRPQSAIDDLIEDDESSPILSSHEVGPEGAQQQRELMEAIAQCLAGLPDDQRVAAVLGDIEGYNYKEIAEIMKTSLGTVKSRISRARAKIRDCLQEFEELLPAGYRLRSEEAGG